MTFVEKPKIGDVGTIYIPGSHPHYSGESVRAFYIGKNPVKTPWFLKINSPEGHVFARENKGEIEVYCTRSDKLETMWMSEGSDGPEWPVGIEVKKIEGLQLDSSEIKTLENKINEWKFNSFINKFDELKIKPVDSSKENMILN